MTFETINNIHHLHYTILYLVSPILVVLLNTNYNYGIVSPTLNVYPTLFIISCEFLGDYAFTSCKYCHLPSDFSSKYQSSMTTFHHGCVRIQIMPNIRKFTSKDLKLEIYTQESLFSCFGHSKYVKCQNLRLKAMRTLYKYDVSILYWGPIIWTKYVIMNLNWPQQNYRIVPWRWEDNSFHSKLIWMNSQSNSTLGIGWKFNCNIYTKWWQHLQLLYNEQHNNTNIFLSKIKPLSYVTCKTLELIIKSVETFSSP